MTNNGIVKIHGKDYMTVAGRLDLAHKDGVIKGIKTEVLQHTPVVVVRATVTIESKEYQGISSANPQKTIEKENPYEVAETSAVGRALGFAGYGAIESVASADEMIRATRKTEFTQPEDVDLPHPAENDHFCEEHSVQMKQRTALNGGHYYDHRKEIDGVWHTCTGFGWKAQQG